MHRLGGEAHEHGDVCFVVTRELRRLPSLNRPRIVHPTVNGRDRCKDPIRASEEMGLALKQRTQLLMIFLVADLNERGQNRCLTAAIAACTPECILRKCSSSIIRLVRSWALGSTI